MLRDPDTDGRYPLSGREYEALQMIMAAAHCLEKTSELLPRLKKVIPYGYRDYQMIKKRLIQLTEAILVTVPNKKLIGIQEELKFLKVKTFYGGILGRQEKGMAFVQADAMLNLLNEVAGMNCLLCEKNGKKVKQCPIREIYNNLFPYDMDSAEDPEDGCQMAGRGSIYDENDESEKK